MTELLAAVPGPYDLLDTETIAWRELHSARVELLQLREHVAMLSCATFAPREQHAEAIASALGLSPLRAGRVIDQLVERDCMRPLVRFAPAPRPLVELPAPALVLRVSAASAIERLCIALEPRMAAAATVFVVPAAGVDAAALAPVLELAQRAGAQLLVLDASERARFAAPVTGASKWLDPALAGGFRRLAQLAAAGASAWLIDDRQPPLATGGPMAAPLDLAATRAWTATAREPGSEVLALPVDAAPLVPGQWLAALLPVCGVDAASLPGLVPETLREWDGERRIAALYTGHADARSRFGISHPRLAIDDRSASLLAIDMRTILPPALRDDDGDAAWLVPALRAVDADAAAVELPNVHEESVVAGGDETCAILGSEAAVVAKSLRSRDAPARLAALAHALADRAQAGDEWLAARLRERDDQALAFRATVLAGQPREAAAAELAQLHQRAIAATAPDSGRCATLRAAFADAAALLEAWPVLLHAARRDEP